MTSTNSCNDIANGNQYWTIDVFDMIENFMNYSFGCDKIFTNQQSVVLRNYMTTNYLNYTTNSYCEFKSN